MEAAAHQFHVWHSIKSFWWKGWIFSYFLQMFLQDDNENDDTGSSHSHFLCWEPKMVEEPECYWVIRSENFNIFWLSISVILRNYVPGFIPTLRIAFTLTTGWTVKVHARHKYQAGEQKVSGLRSPGLACWLLETCLYVYL